MPTAARPVVVGMSVGASTIYLAHQTARTALDQLDQFLDEFDGDLEAVEFRVLQDATDEYRAAIGRLASSLADWLTREQPSRASGRAVMRMLTAVGR